MGSLFLLWTPVLIILGKALSESDVYIDCGSGEGYTDAGRDWQVDEGYTKTGENKAVQLHSSPNSTRLDSLRVFTKNKRNCYRLPAKASSQLLFTTVYLIRASFYYGNYDGHSNPPTFGLEIEGMKWATVTTSNTEPQFHEVLYYAQKDNISVCLVQSKHKHKQFPFINALELDLLSFSDYKFVDDQNPTWLRSYRYSYGADAEDWILGLPGDPEDKIWEPNTPAGLKAVSIPSYSYCVDEGLAPSVLQQAVEAPNPTDTIDLTFTFNGSNDLHHYVRAHFSTKIRESETRAFGFYVNDDFKSGITIDDYSCKNAQANAHSNGTLNVQLRPHGNSTSSPFISGIEIYTVLTEKKKKNLGLLIGLPVGLVLGLILPGLIALFILSRRRTQGQATIPGQGRQANPQQSASATAPVMPSQNGEIPVSSNDGGYQSWVNHEVDMRELEELLQLHIKSMRY